MRLVNYKNTFPKIGSDESGKGDFIGPLITVAIYLENNDIKDLNFVKDSKKLSDTFIKKNIKTLLNIKHKVIKINPKKYNQLYSKFENINKILGWAHATAIKNLIEQGLNPKIIIIDKFGPENRVLYNIKDEKLKNKIVFFNKAEEDTSVAAASMLARYYFVKEMEKLSEIAGFKLPFGASSTVDNAVKELLKRIDKKELQNFVKLHFSNIKRVLN